MRQKLGQHFLINTVKLRAIADALEIKNGDVIIEIGPGHGELTEAVLDQNKKIALTLIEKDPELAAALKLQYEKEKNISITLGDVRELLPSLAEKTTHIRKNYKLLGNIPYYLTGFLFRLVGELPHKPTDIVFMIQKEVAERIAAKKGGMNLLAASIQAWADVEIVTRVSRNDFIPPPEVESAVVKLTAKEKIPEKDLPAYYRTIKILFKQPRKTILNNLVALDALSREEIAKKLEKLSINPSDRPAELEIKDIENISALFAI